MPSTLTPRPGRLAALFLVSLAIGAIGAAAGLVPPPLAEKAQSRGSVRVIVGLQSGFTPEGRLVRSRVAAQRQETSRAQDSLLATLPPGSFTLNARFRYIPYVALTVSPQALAALSDSPLVGSVREDVADPPSLADSIPLIGADQVWGTGVNGAGIAVAILDTGVDGGHPFLSGKVVSEACYSDNDNCPGGGDEETGAGTGVPCTYASDGCRHGTHVSGIAAGGDGTSGSGVAWGAGIIAINVFSEFTGSDCSGAGEDPCTKSFRSDQIKGLERVYDLRGSFTIASANMSLGGGEFNSNCDGEEPGEKDAIDNLRSVGIATVIASGNDGFTDAISFPACITSAVSVGATDKSDVVADFSNSASILHLLAPGVSIRSSVPGGGFAFFDGTSMATPHVTGAWALLKQMEPEASVDTILNALISTGVPITDGKNGLTKPRIDLAAASALFAPHLVCAEREVCNSPGLCTRPVACEVGVAFCSHPMNEAITQGCNPAGPYPVGTNVVSASCSDGVATVTQDCTVKVLDCEAPVCAPPAPLALECNGRCGVAVSDPAIGAFLGAASATDNCTANPLVSVAPPPLFASGCAAGTVTPVTFVARDGAGREDSCIGLVTVRDTTAPSLVVPAGITLECSQAGGVSSSDCEVQQWLSEAKASDVCNEVSVVNNAPGLFPAGCPPGVATPVTFTATDACGNAAALAASVTVVDTTAPVVAPGDDELYCLWPPNHQYVCFDQSQFAPVIADLCAQPFTWLFDGCASNQPDNGNGDGNTQDDCMVAPDRKSFCVRAERDGGSGDARRYAVSIVATDACGNASPATVIGTIDVPTQGPGKGCLK